MNNKNTNQALAAEFANLIERMLTQLDKLDHLEETKNAVNSRLEKIEELVYYRNVNDFLDQFIPLEVVSERFGIPRRRFHQFMRNGEIDFIRLSKKKIFLTKGSLNDFMNRYSYKALHV